MPGALQAGRCQQPLLQNLQIRDATYEAELDNVD
jgi:hypothetical protein